MGKDDLLKKQVKEIGGDLNKNTPDAVQESGYEGLELIELDKQADAVQEPGYERVELTEFDKLLGTQADTSYLQGMQHELKLVWDKKIAPVLSKMNKSIQSQAHGLYQNMQKALGRGEFMDAEKVEDVEHLICHGKKNTDAQKSAQSTKRHPVIKVLVDFFAKVANIAKKGERKGGMGSIDDEFNAASENLGEEIARASNNHRKQVTQFRAKSRGR